MKTEINEKYQQIVSDNSDKVVLVCWKRPVIHRNVTEDLQEEIKIFLPVEWKTMKDVFASVNGYELVEILNNPSL